MGTKSQPGKFDCYAAAEPDEPMFILLARDPSAPIFVALWAAIRADIERKKNQEKPETEKIEEAQACALKMTEWGHKNAHLYLEKTIELHKSFRAVLSDYLEMLNTSES